MYLAGEKIGVRLVVWPCTMSRTRGTRPLRERPESPRRAPGRPPEVFFSTYTRQYAQNVRLTRSFYSYVYVVSTALECYAFCKETRTKWLSISISHIARCLHRGHSSLPGLACLLNGSTLPLYCVQHYFKRIASSSSDFSSRMNSDQALGPCREPKTNCSGQASP